MSNSAKIIADSLNPWGHRITTFELEYPRFIHAEFLTHREFSRNSASSRAIPVSKVISMVYDSPAMPVHWGENQPGMQAKKELSPFKKKLARLTWSVASKTACFFAWILMKLNTHKQVTNRLLEPFQTMKVVMTTTQYENWKWLRLHEDADPTIYALARAMETARLRSKPVKLNRGEWHIPYVTQDFIDGVQRFFDANNKEIGLEDALKISASCCAQVSYRKSDTSLEKAHQLFSKLIESEPCHSSPIEHQAKVMTNTEGITHVGLESQDTFETTTRSGNFAGGWVQYRQLIPGTVKKDLRYIVSAR